MERFRSKLKTFSKSTVAAVLVALVLCGAAIAWYIGETRVELEPIEGTILLQYFHCGTGTEDDPFVITRPIHFYHLIELYQRLPAFASANYYFQIGYDLGGNNDGSLDEDEGEEWLVYDYNSAGTTDGSTSKVLNMEYFSGDRALLPIGTSDVPFNGVYKGNGLTVANLHIRAQENIMDYQGNALTAGTCDVGIFGYLGAGTSVQNAYFDNVTIDLSNLDVENIESEVHNADIHSVPGSGATAYVGMLAGHITLSSTVTDVYVNNCTIIGGDAAKCGFGYFGCVENVNNMPITTLGSTVATLRTKGTDAGFGGTIDMKTTYQRLMTIYKSVANTTSQYVTSETNVYDAASGTTTNASQSKVNVGNNTAGGTTVTYKYYSSDAGGSFNFPSDNDTVDSKRQNNSYQNVYQCLYGESSVYTKTVATYTYTTTYLDALLIHDGDAYLGHHTGGVATVGSADNALRWVADNGGHLYTYLYFDIGNNCEGAEVQYLNASGKSGVTLGDSVSTVWTRTVLIPAGDDPENPTPAVEALTTVIDGTTYYLDYDGGWVLTPVTSYYLLDDGAGHWLSASVSAPGTANRAEDSVKWQLTNPGGATTQIYAYLGDNDKYYLSCDGALTISQSAPTDWSQTEIVDPETGAVTYTYTSSVQGVEYALIYDAQGELWTVMPESGWRIENAENGGRFLTADTSGVSDSAVGSVWQFSSDTGDTTISTIVGDALHYLGYDNGLVTSTTVTTWHRSGDALYTTVGGTDYYLCYDGGWTAVPLTYTVIHDGDHYLRVNGMNQFEDVTQEQATHFYFSSEDGANSSGTAWCFAGGAVYWLRSSADVLATTLNPGDATAWVNDGSGHFGAGTDNDYLGYDGEWKIINAPVYYIVSYNGNYLNLNANGTSFSVGNSADTATHWIFTEMSDAARPSGTVSATVGNTTYYLYGLRSGGGGCGGGNNYTYSIGLTTNANNVGTWTNNNGVLTTSVNNTTVRLRYNNNAWTSTTDNNGTKLNYDPHQDIPEVTLASDTQTQPELAASPLVATPTPVTVDGPVSVNNALGFTATTQQVITYSTTGGIRSGNPTYFPIRVDKDDSGNYPADYAASAKNTGYIVSGANIQESTATGSQGNQKVWGDIRVSGWTISNISSSYANNAFTNIYTTTGNSNAVLTTPLNQKVYDAAKEQLLETLKNSNYVYGLHFMDSTISTAHLITAKQATILGDTYYNYQLPEDSIDFHVVERGYISFFAGAYFTNNNSFFSLHQIFRDESNNITSILEIKNVYRTARAEKDKYVYLLSNNRYFDGETWYDSLPTGYTEVFDTMWIKEPYGISDTETKLYFYQIPCNPGEYALGSVPGRTGAYLVYLDIAANGGDIMDAVVSSEGNDVSNNFKVEFRDRPTVVDHCLLQFAIDAPAVTDPSTFSVHMNFDPNDTTEPHTSGLYTLTVVNKSGGPLTLTVLLCDDDNNPSNEYLYAYKLVYTNADQTDAVMKTTLDANYWRSAATFTIPASGAAFEDSYS